MWLKWRSIRLNVVTLHRIFFTFAIRAELHVLKLRNLLTQAAVWNNITLNTLFFHSCSRNRLIVSICGFIVELKWTCNNHIYSFSISFILYLWCLFPHCTGPLFLLSSILCHHYLMCSCFISWFSEEAQTWFHSALHIDLCLVATKFFVRGRIELKCWIPFLIHRNKALD